MKLRENLNQEFERVTDQVWKFSSSITDDKDRPKVQGLAAGREPEESASEVHSVVRSGKEERELTDEDSMLTTRSSRECRERKLGSSSIHS